MRRSGSPHPSPIHRNRWPTTRCTLALSARELRPEVLLLPWRTAHRQHCSDRFGCRSPPVATSAMSAVAGTTPSWPLITKSRSRRFQIRANPHRQSEQSGYFPSQVASLLATRPACPRDASAEPHRAIVLFRMIRNSPGAPPGRSATWRSPGWQGSRAADGGAAITFVAYH
jgi:hypothetical protein